MSGAIGPMIAKIHIAKKQLGLDEDSYRAVLKRVTGKDSVKTMSAGQMEAVLAEMTRLGFKPVPKASDKPWVRKVHAIWADLAPLLDDATPAALNGFVARQTRSARNPAGISAPEFLRPEDATKVIQGLEGWLARLQAKQGTQA